MQLEKRPPSSISNRAEFDFIRYGSVWEDADILCEALKPAINQGRILSICSSGDNVLALLTLNPSEIVAADLSFPQIACLELRLIAFQELDYQELLMFLGVNNDTKRLETYKKLRTLLTNSSAAFWDAHPNQIKQGIIHAGKFERYLRLFGQWLLPLIHSKKIRKELLKKKSIQEQQQFYTEKWDTYLWRGLFRIFFSKFMMGRLGRDPAFFDQVRGSVAEAILERTKRALTEIPTENNPYLNYIMTGNFTPTALPRYLRPEYHADIKARLKRVTYVQGEIQKVCAGEFQGYNLSDIFEYMKHDEYERCYRILLSHAAPGARLVYWNLLVSRGFPPDLKEHVKAVAEEAKSLHLKQKAWFYQDFHMDCVV